MKVIFDSNVWQIISIPEDPQYANEPLLNDFIKIRQAIVDGRIEAYLSETIFTLEAIKKVERQDFFSSRKLKIDFREKVEGNTVNTGIAIGPEKGIDFSERPILKKYFDKAIEIGFRIISLPRIGGMVNEEIEDIRYKLENGEFSKYFDKACEVSDKIKSNGAGISQIEEIGKVYNHSNWMKGLKKAPQTKHKKIGKAVAEWADGDSVAICIGLECDYFCTRDQAKGAGNKSVLSCDNLEWLKRDYDFDTILPEELAKICG